MSNNFIPPSVGTNRMTGQQQNMTLETLLLGYNNDNVLHWIKKLNFFSFYKSGLIGHLADSDAFVLHIKYDDKHDLLNNLRLLGLRFRMLNYTPPLLLNGIEYLPEDNKSPQNTSEEFNDIECNSKNRIKGIKCNLSLPKGYIGISIRRLPHENNYSILTEKEFENAVKIENFICERRLENKITREFQKYKGYIDKNKLDSMY